MKLTLTKISSVSVIVAVLLLSVSCKESTLEYQEDAECIYFLTRGDNTGGTYRIMVYNTNHNYSTSGTYVDSTSNGSSILVPHALDEDGNKIENSTPVENKAAGIQPTFAGNRLIQCVKPGKINNEGSLSFCPARENLYVSDYQYVSLGKYSPQKITNPLKDRRAKISFNFFKQTDSAEEITVNDLLLVGAGALDDNVVYYPAKKMISAGIKPMNFRLDAGIGKLSDDGKWNLLYMSDVKLIASGYYCTKKDLDAAGISYDGYNIDSQYLWVLFKLRQDNREEISIKLPITNTLTEIQPMSEYVFNLYIKSEMIKVSLEIYSYNDNSNDWEDATQGNQNIDSSESTVIHLGEWNIRESAGQWQTPEDDLTQEI